MPLPPAVLLKYSGAHSASHQAAWEIHTESKIPSYTLDFKLPQCFLLFLIGFSSGPKRPPRAFPRPNKVLFLPTYSLLRSHPFSLPLNVPTSYSYVRAGPWLYSPLLPAPPPDPVPLQSVVEILHVQVGFDQNHVFSHIFSGSVSDSAPRLEGWGGSTPLGSGCDRKTLQDIAEANLHPLVSPLCDKSACSIPISSHNKRSGASSPPTAFRNSLGAATQQPAFARPFLWVSSVHIGQHVIDVALDATPPSCHQSALWFLRWCILSPTVCLSEFLPCTPSVGSPFFTVQPHKDKFHAQIQLQENPNVICHPTLGGCVT